MTLKYRCSGPKGRSETGNLHGGQGTRRREEKTNECSQAEKQRGEAQDIGKVLEMCLMLKDQRDGLGCNTECTCMCHR